MTIKRKYLQDINLKEEAFILAPSFRSSRWLFDPIACRPAASQYILVEAHCEEKLLSSWCQEVRDGGGTKYTFGAPTQWPTSSHKAPPSKVSTTSQ
jgi:hypothetical protein